MKQILRAFLFLLLFTATVNTAIADEKANVTKQGTVRGRIIDATKQTLPGASIYIEKLHTGVTSDVNGFYTFSNLDPGTYTVKVSYVGYSPVELKITIPAGRTLEKDVVLNEGVELQEVVVGGAFQGQRRAINSQKNNMGITNVVSADQVGKFPDSNIGDALKRISGINVQYDQGEARFGQVRGTSADLSSVTINGNRVPSAEGDTRNVQLDLIPADMIQTIEVNKVVTADMDGDAIGGSINLVTKNSPYKRTIAATAGTGYNWVSEKAQLNLGFTYGDRFFNESSNIVPRTARPEYMKNIWREPGQVTNIPKYGETSLYSTAYLENASYLRLKNLSLSYQLPQSLLKKTGFIQGVKFSVVMRNLWTLTNYTGYDPEYDSSIIYGMYPNTRQYSFGLELVF